jgi:hypothetical protein
MEMKKVEDAAESFDADSKDDDDDEIFYQGRCCGASV